MVAATKKRPAKKAVVKKPVKFVPPEVEDGTWQNTVVQSAILKERAAKGDQKAGELLWTGAQAGINDWLDESDDDASAEGLYAELITLMGKSRKGDASKIAKVAVAVKDKGLVLSSHANLSQAYKEASRLIDAAPAQAKEDDAAEALAETISQAAPKSSSTPEGAAKILLGAGVDEFARLVVAEVIDAAGSYEKAEPVLRSLARALSQEIVGTKPKPEPKVKAPAKPKGAAVKKAAVKPASEKAKAAKPKPAPVEDDEVEEDVLEDEDDFTTEDAAIEAGLNSDLEDLLDDDEPEEEAPVKSKAKPVVRRRA